METARDHGESTSAYRTSPRERARRIVVMVAALGVVAWMLAGPAAGSAFAEVPINNSPPEVAQEPGNQGQTPKVGERLVCNPGSWANGVSKFTYQWLLEGIIVAEAEGQSDNGLGGLYTITAADEGYELWCNVIATNGSGSGEEESENSLHIPGPEHAAPPENVEKPKLEYSGEVKVGTKLKCSQGTWTGTPTPTYSYEWLRDGARIALQTTNEYTVETADEGHSLSCKVTATNTAGEAAASSSTVPVKAATPVNIEGKPPKVLAAFAELEVGEMATCEPGEWTGNPTFTYQWWREEPTKKTSGAISGATASTYVVTSEDELYRIYCKVRGTNAEGAYTEATSSNSLLVRGSKPVNKKPPKIEYTGTLELGRKLKCSEGEWSKELSPHEIEVVWVLETELGPESVAFGSSYTPTESRIKGHPLFCEVTVENSAKLTEKAASEPVVVPVGEGGEAPKNTTPPEVRGTPQVGETLDCTEGIWKGTPPLTPSYQWLRDGSAITGATKSTYTVGLADRGYSFSCTVGEVNSEGTAPPVPSSNSLHVKGTVPENIRPPHVSGNAEVKETLTCSQGEWRGEPPPESGQYEYEWLRDGSIIAPGTSYVVTEQDRGYSLTCRVTATNTEGKASQESSNSVHIPGVEPENEKLPEVRGTGTVGAAPLKCTEGKWNGAPTPTLTYQWLLEGREIPSATENTYTVVSADQGHSLACAVTAENVEGAVTVKSKNSVFVPGVAPEEVELPSIEGTAFVGGTLTCERGAWEGKPPPAFTYKWLINGTLVAESISNTYTPEASEVGQTLSCDVLAENDEGHAEAASSNSVVIAAAPTKPQPHQLVEQPAKKPAQSVDPYKTASVATAAEVRSGLSTQLTHVQHIARIVSLLKHGSLSFRFAALGAGKLEVFWYEVPKGAHLASAKVKPILVASATESYASASTKTVTLHLTKTGRRLLAHQTHITLTAEGVFVRSGASAVHWYKTFVLVR